MRAPEVMASWMTASLGVYTALEEGALVLTQRS
jgi:hypothetical protein